MSRTALIGEDSADNIAATTNVVRNVDGSILERLEDIKADLSGTAGIATWAAGAAAADAVSISEAIRYAQENIIVGTGTALPANSSLYGVLAGATGIPTWPAAAAPADAVSLAEAIREMYNQEEKAISTAAAVIANGTATIFTVAGGPIEVLNILSVCVTANDATATTLKYTADPTDGTATDLCAASGSLASATAGTIVNITGTLANAAVITAQGTAISQAGRVVVPAGVIQAITATGPTTGTWTHHLRYKPLARGVTVS